MKHDSNHKLDVACLDCVRTHIAQKERLIAYVERLSEVEHYEYPFSGDDILMPSDFLKELEKENEGLRE